MIDANGLLMIHPSAVVSAEPVLDELTRKMTAAWRKRRTDPIMSKGIHICPCGVASNNQEHFVEDAGGNELITNSLSIHYLAFHRAEVPAAELDKVRFLPHGEETPDSKELSAPPKR
jgi:hypothetical protein